MATIKLVEARERKIAQRRHRLLPAISGGLVLCSEAALILLPPVEIDVKEMATNKDTLLPKYKRI